MSEDKIICNCFDVKESTIRESITLKKLKTVEGIGEETKAGTGCGYCVEQLEEILKEELVK